MFVSVILSAFLLACTAGFTVWHVGAWKKAKQRDLDPKERQYRSQQYRRRMLTSVLMAILASLLPVGQWIMIQADQAGNPRSWWPKAGVIFVGVVLFLLAWIALLALSDFISTKFFYGRLRDKYQLEQTRLQAELRQLQKSGHKGNGNSGRKLGEK